MVSKHHYALELAKRGNTVYFLNPPDLNEKYFELNNVAENLQVISYKPLFRGKKYLPGMFFNLMLYLQVRFLLKKIQNRIDVVWSFDSSIYLNLSWFKAKTKIYFIADNNENSAHLNIARSADLVLSVSSSILYDMEISNKSYFINHGLSDFFATKAYELGSSSLEYKKENSKVKVAYIGNLLIKSLDRKVFKEIIIENPHVEFVLFGSYEFSDSNLGSFYSQETEKFIEFLKQQENVLLKGVFHSNLLSKVLVEYNAFLILINPQNDYNYGANSHKVLEYLSAGKVIISNHLSSYRNKRELIEMVDEMHNDKLPALFKKVIGNLEYYNRAELQKMRIEYALDNTYLNQIERIELLINQQSGN